MSAIARPKMFLAATAALVAAPAASSLISARDANSSRSRRFGRPSFLRLDAGNRPFSELDRLRAKRMSIRRRLPEPEVEEATEYHDDEDVPNVSLVGGLEYLYEAGEERHSDDLFHIVLMPSTFKKDHMTIANTAESCTTVLGIPTGKAQDLSLFAKHQGFSCLGTWTREECLAKGEELLLHDLDCRVIPFNGGVASSDPLSESGPVDVAMYDQDSLSENTYLSTLGA